MIEDWVIWSWNRTLNPDLFVPDITRSFTYLIFVPSLLFMLLSGVSQSLVHVWFSLRMEWEWVVVTSTMAEFTWGPFDTEPISWELHLVHWCSLWLFDAMIIKAFSKTAICVSDSTWPAWLNVKIFAYVVFIFFVENHLYTSTTQTWHILKWTSAAVIHAKNSCSGGWIFNYIT